MGCGATMAPSKNKYTRSDAVNGWDNLTDIDQIPDVHKSPASAAGASSSGDVSDRQPSPAGGNAQRNISEIYAARGVEGAGLTLVQDDASISSNEGDGVRNASAIASVSMTELLQRYQSQDKARKSAARQASTSEHSRSCNDLN
eukprot:TRINITY_DN75918_c0_g1_i1.p1 TRINITY_DN75918_c0_g1~~TRINITY_DN75918_c0_g1_i1.p1  ORF type:complete len:144 (+),score=16.88 TRINITY_DN75918_c0_g1_i1:131-562(+)